MNIQKHNFYKKYILALATFLTAFIWTIGFPEFTFTSDIFQVKDESGKDITKEVEKEEDLYYDIVGSGESQIQIKSKLLEWIGEKNE